MHWLQLVHQFHQIFFDTRDLKRIQFGNITLKTGSQQATILTGLLQTSFQRKIPKLFSFQISCVKENFVVYKGLSFPLGF